MSNKTKEFIKLDILTGNNSLNTIIAELMKYRRIYGGDSTVNIINKREKANGKFSIVANLLTKD